MLKKKEILVFIVLPIILVLSFLAHQTFTIDKLCGWNAGEKTVWPCLCLGWKHKGGAKTSVGGFSNVHLPRTSFYCTGLNLSCNSFMLENFYFRDRDWVPKSCDEIFY